jgi:hypothetical protein
MGQYSVGRYSNGTGTFNGTPFQEEQCKRNKPTTNLANTLASSDVFVIGSNAATLLDIVNNWDQQTSPYSSTNPTVLTAGGPVTMNGDDAMVLRRWTGGVAGQGNPVIIDLIGVVGHLPTGGAWFTNTVDPITGQTITVSTKNMSLKRKPHISAGTTVNPNSATYQVGDEWDVYSAFNGANPATAADYFAQSYANLAGHAADYTGGYGAYAPLGVLEYFDKGISVFPNPVSSKEVTVKIENTKVASITIINALGQNISVNPTNAAQQEIKVNVASLKPGMYFVKFVSADQYKMSVYKPLIVQ